ncbi:hypothetical protein BRE01_37770 [Brevibacillus reuszeri]|uniref:Uncharacterized protein n=1 Tax=Brevibacillus reuszeri TaxID=54915 RepID=A0ABQ0TQH9_9BACL|nr:hypothetical protein BRE01_37770 [Brevibacillus reuszeri]
MNEPQHILLSAPVDDVSCTFNVHSMMGRSESIRSELQEQGIRFVQTDLREEESVRMPPTFHPI